MRGYRELWLIVAGILGAIGLVGVLLATPLGVIMGVAIAAGGTTWVGWRALRRRSRRPVSRGAGAAAGAVGAVAALLIVGLSAFVGSSSAMLIGLCAVVAAPPTLRWLATGARQVWRRASRHAGDQPPPAVQSTAHVGPAEAPSTRDHARQGSSAIPPTFLPPARSVRDLSDAELCWAWRTSFTALQRYHLTADLERRAQLVHLRQQYLDELERRNPAGFRRWLYTGARPASDPSRYIATPQTRSTPRSALPPATPS